MTGRAVLGRVGLLALPLAGILIWFLVDVLARPPSWMLPSPQAVASTLWSEHDRLWFHAQATIGQALLGLALAVVVGLAIAVVISASRAADLAIYPWVVASQAVPILAIAPIIAVWLDYGAAQVAVAFIICVFPVIVTGVDGLRSTDPQLGRVALSLGASRMWVWRRVTLPAALPALFSGLRLAAVFAVTGAVVAEYVGADRGLGYLTEISTSQFETQVAFAAIAWLAVIGIALFAAVSGLERLALPHRHHSVRPAWRTRRGMADTEQAAADETESGSLVVRRRQG
jgi:ABC-type nitrate/sulfonate/bicarbonate transport system permease component